MAKKKNYPVAVSVIGASDGGSVYDNNPTSGLVDLPNGELNGCYYPKDKFDFVNLVAAGESQNRPDVYVATANDVASSQGEGDNPQYNYWKGTDGRWNKNHGWSGGNLTGQ